MTSHEILRKGGKWLGAVRTYIQSKKICGNGESITWGSNTVVEPRVTMKEVEEIGATAVSAYMNEKGIDKALEMIEKIKLDTKTLMHYAKKEDAEKFFATHWNLVTKIDTIERLLGS